MKNRTLARYAALVITALWLSSAFAGWTLGGDASTIGPDTSPDGWTHGGDISLLDQLLAFLKGQ